MSSSTITPGKETLESLASPGVSLFASESIRRLRHLRARLEDALQKSQASAKVVPVPALEDNPSLKQKGEAVVPKKQISEMKAQVPLSPRKSAPQPSSGTKRPAPGDEAQEVSSTRKCINLNQSIVLSSIGYNRTSTTWLFLHDNTVGNLIITAAGFLPGYYLSIVSIEYIGRKPIQLLGFFGTTLMLWVVAGTFETLKRKSGAFIACFTLLQLLFNFGANTTTFISASETFPTRVRGFASGFSAACGKVGAVIAALAFSVLQTKVGTPTVLWIFGGINVLGGLITIFCTIETKGYDADIVDVQERQEKAGYQNRVEA